MPDMEPAEEQVHEQEPDGAEVETEKEDGAGTEAKQCRICLDGDDDPDLGRLIRPCLCKGSMTYVHVSCLNRWRANAASRQGFFKCSVCGYRYRLGRTRVAGIASNPVVTGALSAFLFTLLVLAASFVTTFFTAAIERPSSYWSFGYGYDAYGMGYYDPWDVARDLVRATLRIIRDEPLFDEPIFRSARAAVAAADGAAPEMGPKAEMGWIGRLLRRFVLGLPVVGAGSLIQMLSFPLLGPVQWLARLRGRGGSAGRGRRGDSRDMAAVVIVVLLLVGAARALVKVYTLTQELTQRVLARAEDAILEVN
ncbi:hypothetical protein FIBSPDRAFT_934405 [Athelia psychrophila]|uniref:RING-CH-type domain-containing protein n=1 Tax=Athelia psychrophila TaxID=1759441 RepID=A0A166FHP9_9AGAM|nr:hypothetical protein FIBSPDRAFT_934405 [Fibularhizoctonia sp. CBS 109695]